MEAKSMTVPELQRRLRDAGLPHNGRKKQLVERLNSYYASEQYVTVTNQSLQNRVAEVESMLYSIQTSQSPPQLPPLSMSSSSHARSESATVVATTFNPVEPTNTVPRVHFGPVTTYSTAAGYAIGIQSAPFEMPRTVSNYANHFVPSVTDTRYVQIPHSPIMSTTARAGHDEQYVQAMNVPPVPPSQPRTNAGLFMNAHDVIAILPEFDPLNKNLSSVQFLERVEQLKQVYYWDDKLLLFAIQAKLRGVAKMWVDGFATVFTSWEHFAREFIAQFPSNISLADIHMELMSMRRAVAEDINVYFYRVLASARRGGLDEQSIIKYVINGINDSDMKKCISVQNYSTSHELLLGLQNYCTYNPLQRQPNKLVQAKYVSETVKTTNSASAMKGVSCYNCRKYGHFSRNCPEPKRRDKCTRCNKHGHKTEDCPNNKSTPCNKIEIPGNKLLTKVITIGTQKVHAMIDSGSACSLIRKKIAESLGSLIPCKTTITAFGGTNIECTVKINAKIMIDEVACNGDLLVMSDDMMEYDALIGNDILCAKDNLVVISGNKCAVSKIPIGTTAKKGLQELLTKFSGRFSTDVSTLGKCNTVKMKINLTTEEPIQMKPYRTPFARRPEMKRIINELLLAEVIGHSTSPYASPALLVPKKNNEFRLCIDYKRLNAITVKQPYPMPLVEEIFAQLSNQSIFSKLDFNMGYHQIEMDEASRAVTAFVADDVHCEFYRMPMGLVNAPAVFQEMINGVIQKLPQNTAIAYLDDVIIPSCSEAEGLIKLENMLKELETTGLTLRQDKCKFLITEIDFLGHKISGDGIKPGTHTTDAITKFKRPDNVTEVRRFLGLTGFFRKFVEGYSLIAKPLTALTKKDALKKFQWGDDQESAFKTLIGKLTSKPILALYDYRAEHEVHCDASHVGLAAVLMQLKPGESSHQAVFYFSRQCTDAESRYHSYELELLAVVEALQRFRVYLLGKPFKVMTDCSAVTSLKAKNPMNPRVSRWWMKLSEYDLAFVHRASSKMQHVDALSRAPIESTNTYTVAHLKLATDDWLYSMQWQDEKVRNIIEVLKGNLKSGQEEQFKKDYKLINNRLYRRNPEGMTLVVPKAVRWQVVRHCHDETGHFGLENTIKRIKRHFWFPRMRKYAKDYIAACVECCYHKSKGGKPEGQLHTEPMEPIPFRLLHIDHLGPFIKSKRGFTHILAISDAFSKYIVVKAVRNTKTQPVLNALDEISSIFGLPQAIVSDRGTAFTSDHFTKYCTTNDIRHIKTAVRTPRANGQVERANQTILSFLKTTTDNPKDWDTHLRNLQWSINSQANSTTRFTPNELVFDFPLRDLAQNRLLAAVVNDDVQTSCSERRMLALEHITAEREKWKKRFDSKHSTPQKYNIGDLVVLKFITPATGESRKLEPQFRGPYVIAKVIGNDRYLVEDLDGLQHTQKRFSSIYSADNLKPWCAMPPDLHVEDDIDSDGEINDADSHRVDDE